MNNQFIQSFIIQLPPLMLAISVHEAAHGYMAARRGDLTAKMLGRVTLNPIKHIDPMGTVLVPIILAMSGAPVFGWAKPVPISPRNFKNPRKDNMVVSLAGPLSNFMLAFILALVLRILLWVPGYEVIQSSPVLQPLVAMVYAGVKISVILGVFNLLPIFPLDGSHVLEGLLPPQQAMAYSRINRYGPIILLLLIFTGMLWKIIFPFYKICLALILAIFGL